MKICPECGRDNNDNSKFCENCGYNFVPPQTPDSPSKKEGEESEAPTRRPLLD